MIDLHCHVLPGVDDGPAELAGALELARGAAGAGITTIAATPHVDWSHPANDAARIAAAVDALQGELDAAGIDVRVVPGAEVAVTRAVDLPDDELRALTLGGGPWLLLECPLSPALAPGFGAAARSLAVRGHRLLLAHPERSPAFQRDPGALADLVAGGMLAQVTAGSLTGRIGRTVRDTALRMVRDGTVHVAASDAHGPGREASIAAELGEAGLEALAPWLGRDAPAAILAGEPLPPRPEAPEPARRGLRRLLRSRA
ncbi:MAG TPA: CpsB/CapC family capsule biosynthesis tyrosine phosphatase [Solirubrobacteraceae bacterium]|nr:CpsB/CapC family capsule biosynthesis tyrosine phosphatase [Solirubrobacteraceae bacterium]